ncbi:transposase [Streptomyces sp. NPDC001220]
MGNRPWIVEDELWELIEPLLPPWPRKPPGPRPVDDRRCLQGILYVLYNDVSRQLLPLPLELGFGSGRTCWRRPGRWHEAGVFETLHGVHLAELHAADALDWTRACTRHARTPREEAASGPGWRPCRAGHPRAYRTRGAQSAGSGRPSPPPAPAPPWACRRPRPAHRLKRQQRCG